MRSRYWGVLLLGALGVVVLMQPLLAAETPLKFKADGTFKILLMSDLHASPNPADSETAACLALMEKLLELEKPDLVVLNGDVALSNPGPNGEFRKKAVARIAEPLEKAGVPWAITLGNHDGQFPDGCTLTRPKLMGFYEGYPHNLNAGWTQGIHGVGNKNLLIFAADGKQPLFNVWLVDSNGDPPTLRPDVTPEEYRKWKERVKYDWIHTDQVLWYYQTSQQLESKYGAKIPGLMFFHIPLPEHAEMVINTPSMGERHEHESNSTMNSGLFAAVLDRGDVRGIFCGHDHTNNYLGLWNGIQLGYDGVVGYNGYPHTPPEDATNDHARCARVFVLKESDPARYRTYMRFRDGSTNWESKSDNYMRSWLKMDPGL